MLRRLDSCLTCLDVVPAQPVPRSCGNVQPVVAVTRPPADEQIFHDAPRSPRPLQHRPPPEVHLSELTACRGKAVDLNGIRPHHHSLCATSGNTSSAAN